MPLTLAQMPTEALANITSHLSASDILDNLFKCGNRLLCTKLKTGGVSRLSVEDPGVAEKHLKLILTLPLETLRLDRLGYRHDLRYKLLRGCHASLLRIEVWKLTAEDIFVHTDSGRLPPQATAWAIRDTYPNLTSLILHDCATTDSNLACQIMRGLPASLVELTLFSTPEIDIIPKLPPNLTTLHNLRTITTAAHAIYLCGLTSLSLVPKPPKQYYDRIKAYGVPNATQEEVSDLPLVIPPNLTYFDLECPIDMLLSLSSLPSGLTAFSVTVPSGSCNPFDLLRKIPPSVTNLSIAKLKIRPNDLPDTLTTSSTMSQQPQAFTLDAVRTFSFSGSLAIESGPSADFVHSQFLRDLINTVPYAESFALSFSGDLEPEHLVLFKNPRLHTLKAPLKTECLSKTFTGTSILQDVFPNLLSLCLESNTFMDSHSFNLAGLPKTLTSLSSTMRLSFAQLKHVMWIPHRNFKICVSDSEFEQATILDTPSVSQAATHGEAASSRLPLVSSSCYYDDDDSSLFQSKIDGSFLLHPPKSDLGDAYLEIGKVLVYFYLPGLKTLPTRLTELWIRSMSLEPLRHTLKLPLLTKLTLVGIDAKSPNLGAFPSLLDLTLDCDGQTKADWGGDENDCLPILCPPKLTRLCCNYEPSEWLFKRLTPTLTFLEVESISLKLTSQLHNLKTLILAPSALYTVSRLRRYLPFNSRCPMM